MKTSWDELWARLRLAWIIVFKPSKYPKWIPAIEALLRTKQAYCVRQSMSKLDHQPGVESWDGQAKRAEAVQWACHYGSVPAEYNWERNFLVEFEVGKRKGRW